MRELLQQRVLKSLHYKSTVLPVLGQLQDEIAEACDYHVILT